jgi:hypothetical protein
MLVNVVGTRRVAESCDEQPRNPILMVLDLQHREHPRVHLALFSTHMSFDEYNDLHDTTSRLP